MPTPALVAPIEFTLRADDYAALGGYASRAVTLEDVLRAHKVRLDETAMSAIAARLPDGRLHLQHGPIDLIIEAFGAARRGRARLSARRSTASATSCRPWCASCRPCAARSARPIRCCRARSRAAWPRPCGRIAPSSSRRWPRSPAPSPTRCCRRWCAAARSTRPMSTTAATSPSISTPGHEPARRHLRHRRSTAWRRLTHDQPGARHRHLGPRRPLLLARHRRFGDGAGRDRRRRRRRRDPDRQRGEHRSPVDRAPAGARRSIPTATSAICR